MYTNNTAEFGGPLPAVTRTARAMGLNWLTATDHSCDLDETGDGSFSYATTHWEYTIQDESGTHTIYRDNTAIGSTWDVLGEEVSLFDLPELRLFRAVELNASSIDSDSYQKTLHCLIYNEDYIDSPLSGAIGERPVTPNLPAALSQIARDGFAYAAHPLYNLGSEWGGLDLGVNGALWGDEDIETALLDESFRGLEAFNTRSTRYSGDKDNPWPDFDAGTLPDDPYPNELLAGIDSWDQYLQANLGEPIRKIFLAGGSDAHGDFNYSTYLSLSGYATDNAIGKVQTVVYVPDTAGAGYGSDNLPPASEIMYAYRSGRSVVTDGPFVHIGVDRNEDGDFSDAQDLMIGDMGESYSGYFLPLTVSWASTQGFGQVVSVEIIAGNAAGTTTIFSSNPSAGGEGWSGERVIDLGPLGFDGQYYLRAECLTDRGDDSFRAYTNPIWIYFDPASAVSGPRVHTEKLELRLSQCPFEQKMSISVQIPPLAQAKLVIYDVSGRPINTFDIPAAQSGEYELVWDGSIAAGSRAPSGVYFLKLTQGHNSVTAKAVLLR
jgi:hypothetical protein